MNEYEDKDGWINIESGLVNIETGEKDGRMNIGRERELDEYREKEG